MFWLRSHGTADTANAARMRWKTCRIASKFVSPSEDEALDLVKRALANRDPGKVEILLPPRRRDAGGGGGIHRRSSEARDGRIERCDWLSSMDVDGLLMEGVLVVYAGKTGPGERLAFLTPDETGVWKVDFEAFARIEQAVMEGVSGGRADHAPGAGFRGQGRLLQRAVSATKASGFVMAWFRRNRRSCCPKDRNCCAATAGWVRPRPRPWSGFSRTASG